MVRTKNILLFNPADTNLSGILYENGMIRVIHLTLPDFTTAISVSRIDVFDDEGAAVFTSTAGWAENASHTIGNLAVPVDRNYTVRLTLNAVSGGVHSAIVKTYIEFV